MIDALAHQKSVIIFLTLYLSSFLFIGWRAGKRLPQQNIKDYFLAGNQLGALVLVFTLFATQYSGITFIGFIGKAYHVGFNWWIFSLMLTSVVVCYLIYAPKLKRIADQQNFITPVDYLQFRFNSKTLNLSASLIMAYALSNYLITQLMVIGRVGESLSPNHSSALWYIGAILILSAIMLIYESIGGMLAVAWTDMIQGGMMLLCLYAAFFLIDQHYGGIVHTLHTLEITKQSQRLLALPTMATCRSWLSYILMVGLGASIYPQAIQRIFAAKNLRSLNKSFIGMIWLPLIIAIPVILLGLIAAANIPHLTAVQSEHVMPIMLLQVMQHSLLAKIIALLFFAAVLSAIMSTADSVLLSLTSIIMNDIGNKDSNMTNSVYLRRCKIAAFLILLVFMLLAILLRQTTIIKMLDVKFDILTQLVPAFFLGLYHPKISSKAIVTGLISAVLIALTGIIAGYGKIANIHIGLYALILNLTIVCGYHFLITQKISPAHRS